jgi:two-component system OmpR family sensor kinase
VDGRQVKHTHSLQRKLNHWITFTTLIFVSIAGILSGAIAFFEARDLQDDILQEIAGLVRVNQLTENKLHSDDNDDESIIIQRLDSKLISQLQIRHTLEDGLQTLNINDEDWRVLVLTQRTSSQRFIVAQQTELRDEIAWNSSLNVFFPILSLAIITLIIINLIIINAFRPLKKLAANLDKRDGTELNPLPETNMLEEVAPFLLSINGLLARTQQNIQKQQRFIADAAHELRTPVAALSILSENIQNASTEEDRKQRQRLLQQGLDRLGLLVAQLLDLARLQSDYTGPKEIVSFNRVVQDAITELYSLAEAKQIDLGISHQDELTVLDQGNSLCQLVSNAIDNAIRYTPDGGTINVSLIAEAGNAIFRVEDTGSGVPEEELQLIFEPFYRTQGNSEPGNGLGLAISLEIARNLGGHITLLNCENGGLQFQYMQHATRGK